MHRDEADVAEKIVRGLTERDAIDDGEAMVAFSAVSAGIFSAACFASVRGSAKHAELDGRYEVEVRVRRVR